MQECSKALKSGGLRALTELICMAKIQFLWRSCIICGPHGSSGSYAYDSMHAFQYILNVLLLHI